MESTNTTMTKRFFFVWKAVLGFTFALFIAGISMVLTTWRIPMPVGEVVAWTITILSILCIIAVLVYGFIIQRINDIASEVSNLSKKVTTRDEIRAIETAIDDTVSMIKDAYSFATIEILKAGRDFGLVMVYKTRHKAEAELIKDLHRAKTNVKFLGICINITTRIPDFKNFVKKKVKEENVSFQFAFLKRDNTNGGGDFYQQRALDENHPAKCIPDLRIATTGNIDILKTIHESFSDEEKKANKIEIREYMAFPYLSMIIIDDVMFVGTYLFGENCPIMPMYKIEKKDGGVYDTYYKHFKQLWESAKEAVVL